jgi:type II secretory pathway component PulM
MRALMAAGLLLVSSAAYAQQTPPTSAQIEQALSDKTLAEVSENIQLRAQLVQARDQIKDLQEKANPKKPAGPELK